VATEEGTVGLTRSTVSNNTSGGVYGGGGVFVDHSTVSGNTAANTDVTAGIMTQGGSMFVTNSTISGNPGPEAAVYNSGSVHLSYVTVTGNTSTESAEGFQAQGLALPASNVNAPTFFSFASVVVNPGGGRPNCAVAEVVSSGYNYDDDGSCNFNATGDTSDGADPGLGPLANNGGTTKTHKPGADSPLIDAIPPGDCQGLQGDAAFKAAVEVDGLDDQIGTDRPVGEGCDIGALEVLPSTPGTVTVSVTADPDTATEGGTDGAFIFHRSGGAGSALHVFYTVSGTATSGTDYDELGAVDFAAGDTDVTVPVNALLDGESDPDVTVTVTVTPGAYAPTNPQTATVTIIDGEGACDNAPEAPYNDRADFDVHARAIDCITAYGLAEGFDDGSYGALLPVTRAQMASFVARLLEQAGVAMPADPPAAVPGDDGGVDHELHINQLAALGVLDDTTGQTPPAYNVSASMQRDDMAQLLVNAYEVITGEPLAEGPDAFTDDDASDNEAAINALAAIDVVQGTGGGLYDPSGPVTRRQFASFFARFVQVLVDAGILEPLPAPPATP
jgi:hypothetical protein